MTYIGVIPEFTDALLIIIIIFSSVVHFREYPLLCFQIY